jgi:hypothetical protein
LSVSPIETITVADARSLLLHLPARLHEGGRDAEPIFIGSDGEPRGVLISIELFEELSSRRAAVSSGDVPEIHPLPTA